MINTKRYAQKNKPILRIRHQECTYLLSLCNILPIIYQESFELHWNIQLDFYLVHQFLLLRIATLTLSQHLLSSSHVLWPRTFALSRLESLARFLPRDSPSCALSVVIEVEVDDRTGFFLLWASFNCACFCRFVSVHFKTRSSGTHSSQLSITLLVVKVPIQRKFTC
jgi:hypothetical protein